MAHEVENMFSVGAVPWHGLGTILDNPPSVEDAIKMAGLDWTVRLEPLQLVADGRGVSHKATVRESDDSILGVVGPKYHPLQNAKAFDFFAPFVESGAVSLEAAGSLRSGGRVWVLARVSDGVREVQKGDPVVQYVLLSNSHDGSLAIRVGFTVVRVVCMNTLRAAISSSDAASKLIRVRHTARVEEALEAVREVLDLARAEFVATTDQMKRLAAAGCDELTLRRYVREVFAPGKADDESVAKRIVAQVVPLFESGRGAELHRGTLWGAYNAVTEYITHERGRTADARVESQWFGDGARLIDRAFEQALSIAA